MLTQLESQSELRTKWKDHKAAKEYLENLFDARQNIFMHGPNAVGKSTFVHDVMRMYNYDNRDDRAFFNVYVDCVEHYSEKLIAIAISRGLNNAI